MRVDRLFTDEQYRKYTQTWWEKILDWIFE